MQEVFWMVWCPQGGAPQYRHTSLNAAVVDARLAAQSTGREFIVLQSVGTAKNVDVNFTPHKHPLSF